MERTYFLTASQVAAIDGALLDYIEKIKDEIRALNDDDEIERATHHYNAAKKTRDEILK